jgi:hypothetical protein
LIQPLEIVALRGNVFQTLGDIEKPRLSYHPTDGNSRNGYGHIFLDRCL